jgi:molybdopterin-containing oxidoreductase family iron-sulfur binding subunit
MNEAWRKSALDPRFRILNGNEAERREPAWVHDNAMLRKLGPEFAEGADLPPDAPTRRRFLQIMGASAALAGAGGCINQPQEEIVPYVRPPEQIIPGKALYYATAMTHAGASLGLLVETHMGRPVKVEGNPLHPSVPEAMPVASASLPPAAARFGATDAFAQASVLSLYDPDRSQTILHNGQIDTWETLFTEMRGVMERLAPGGGQGLYILTEQIVSPTTIGQLQQLLTQYPNARWRQYEPINDDNARIGAQMAFGADVAVNYVGQPEVVLSLDADCLADGPQHLQLARQIRGQVLTAGEPQLTRLYVVETTSTITGAAADHRLPLSPRNVVAFATSVAQLLGLDVTVSGRPAADDVPAEFLEAVVNDLGAARGRSLVIAGRSQPPEVHSIVHWLNSTLGNVGHTVEYRAPSTERSVRQLDSLTELVSAMQSRAATALVIIGGNPAYDAPGDVPFAEALKNVPFTMHLSEYANETSVLCKWHVPKLHLFESWDDTLASDGTASIVQPLIAPLYEGKTFNELVAALNGFPSTSSHDLVRAFWRQRLGFAEGDPAFERAWKTALHEGVIRGTATETQIPAIRGELAARLRDALSTLLGNSQEKSLTIAFRPDPSVWDGRFANNAWLQELPRPLTKLTWDNAALMSSLTAGAHRITPGDIVAIEVEGRQIEIPATVLPGHPRDTITLHLGYGREGSGGVGNDVGTNVYPLRTSDAMWFAEVKNLRKTGRRYELATTQHHHHMEGRHLVRSGTLAQLAQNPEHPPFMDVAHTTPEVSLYPERPWEGYQWGMVVNQSACIGCSACVVACQAENNIPVVGKDQVARGREMHWLRIDNYYEGEAANPVVYHQPVLCMHCEYAPCEPVCPVAATSHSEEGLNEMTYNRCVGTRYCSNNCPYKVRRFNFYDYNTALREEPLQHLRPNPDVTVRSRGVMEKCTYCVQRINAARIGADIENRQIRDGEILTACQAACPTQALTFGNLEDPRSEARQLRDSSLNYSLLGELNTRPRTTYLAVVRNPNPDLKAT